MTESELLEHICAMAGRPADGGQPPFAGVAIPLHPDVPIDYEDVRRAAFDQVLGPSDFVFHPSVGAPHIDVYRYPPGSERRFWCYATNGMSDFPQNLPDGSTFRSEVICYARSESALWPEFLHVLGTFPFRCHTFLHAYHTIPFPEGIGSPEFTYTMTIPPFLTPELARLRFLGQPLLVIAAIRITAAERERAVQHTSAALVDELPDVLDTWLMDGRGAAG